MGMKVINVNSRTIGEATGRKNTMQSKGNDKGEIGVA